MVCVSYGKQEHVMWLGLLAGGGWQTEMPCVVALLCLCRLSGPQREKHLINIFPHCKTHTLSSIFDWWLKRTVSFWPFQWKIDMLSEYKAKGNQNLFLIITDTVGDFLLISHNTFWVSNYLPCYFTSLRKLHVLDMQSWNILYLAIPSSTLILVEQMREIWINANT